MRLLVALACLFALPAVAQTLPDTFRKAGVLRVATYPNYPPLTFRDTASNARQGFDVEMAEAIAATLGVKVDWQEMPFVQFIPSLQTGRIDMALDGIGDLPARRDTVDFVDYFRTGAIFFTLSATSSIQSPTDFCGLRVGASRSTSWPADITAWSDKNCVGRKPIEVVGTEGSIDTRTQLRTGRLDGGVQGSETIGWLMKTDPGVFRPVGTAFTQILGGIPFAKTESGVREAVRGAVQTLMDNGQYAAMLAKWNLTDNAIPTATVNGQKP
jgi:polar amino acid transport system substrate-binding protein